MGRAPCCEKNEVKRGPWTPEEDKLLVDYIRKNGCGNWRTLPNSAGLQRCGKSCRLRWTNYLRPDIKRGRISFQEEDTIIQLHTILGNKWSAIAARLPGRTDNEIKNYWNTHIRKRLLRMGIDPVTHRYCTHLLQLELDSIINSSHSITSSHTRLLRMQMQPSSNYPETMSLASSLIQNHQINHQAQQLLQMQIPFQDFTFPANCFDHQLMHYGGESFLQNFSGLEFEHNGSLLLTEDFAAANYYGSGQPGMDPASSLDCFDLQSNISTPLSTPTMLQY